MKKVALTLFLLVVTLGFLTPCVAAREGRGSWVVGPLTLTDGDALQINILNVSNFWVDGSLQFYDLNGRLIGAGPILWDENPPPDSPKHVLFFDSENPTTDESINRAGIDFIDGVLSLTQPELQPIWAKIETNIQSATKVLLPTIEVRYANVESVIFAIPLPIP